MKHFTVSTPYDTANDCYFELGSYMGGNLAIQIMSESEGPYATLTVNLGKLQDKNYAFVDTNNCPWAPDLIEKLGIGTPTGKGGRSGFCLYPLYTFNREALKVYSL